MNFFLCALCAFCAFCGQKQEDPVITDPGPRFGGKALKERSEGNWRSGRRRSGESWRRGLGQRCVYSASCHFTYEHLACHEKVFLEMGEH
jgi:hypothetical protein